MTVVDSIVRAVLYEGYMLYPYRPTSVKNRQRWTFGGVYPRTYVDASGSDACVMQTECIVQGDDDTRIAVRVGFLHLIERDVRALDEPVSCWPATGEPASRSVVTLEIAGRRFDAWQEASEELIDVPRIALGAMCGERFRVPFKRAASRAVEPLADADNRVLGALVRTREAIDGRIELRATTVDEETYRLTVRVLNATPVREPERLSRDEASRFALVSCHVVSSVEGGAFVSSIDPPAELATACAECKNIGLWPVLAGKSGAHDTMLAAPIILYDYPQVAPESAGDLFDGTEIDEILTLRILTLTDEEKREMRAADERSRALLERIENMSMAQLQQLHGTLREVRPGEGWKVASSADEPIEPIGGAQQPAGADPWGTLDARPRLACLQVGGVELKIGDRVVLHPHARADIFDLALRDQVATIESIERDFEDRVHLAVTVDCDPGRDFGFARMPGHRFFFAPDEIEPLGSRTLPKDGHP